MLFRTRRTILSRNRPDAAAEVLEIEAGMVGGVAQVAVVRAHVGKTSPGPDPSRCPATVQMPRTGALAGFFSPPIALEAPTTRVR